MDVGVLLPPGTFRENGRILTTVNLLLFWSLFGPASTVSAYSAPAHSPYCALYFASTAFGCNNGVLVQVAVETQSPTLSACGLSHMKKFTIVVGHRFDIFKRVETESSQP